MPRESAGTIRPRSHSHAAPAGDGAGGPGGTAPLPCSRGPGGLAARQGQAEAAGTDGSQPSQPRPPAPPLRGGKCGFISPQGFEPTSPTRAPAAGRCQPQHAYLGRPCRGAGESDAGSRALAGARHPRAAGGGRADPPTHTAPPRPGAVGQTAPTGSRCAHCAWGGRGQTGARGARRPFP